MIKRAHCILYLILLMASPSLGAVDTGVLSHQGKGHWRIRHLESSLIADSTLFNPQNLQTMKSHPLLGQVLSIDQSPQVGANCQELEELPRDKKTLYRLSLAGKNDFAFKELEKALGTCQLTDLRNTSSKFLENLIELSLHCKPLSSNANLPQKLGEIEELTSITLLSTRYALAKTKNLYICLEKIPPIVENPKILAKPLRLIKALPSPLLSERTMAQNIPELCSSPSFVEMHPDESPLGLWLGKTRVVYTEAVEAALATCGIPLGGNPQRSVRLMKHYGILCGQDLKIPSQNSTQIEWIAIAKERQIITSAGGYFYCLEPRASLSH